MIAYRQSPAIVALAAVVCAGLAIAGSARAEKPAGDDPSIKDSQRLLGTWREVSHEEEGNADYEGLTWRFEEERVVIWYPQLPKDEFSRYDAFRIDATSRPKKIDLIQFNVLREDPAGRHFQLRLKFHPNDPLLQQLKQQGGVVVQIWTKPGIYQWEGERLKTCWSLGVTLDEQAVAGMRPKQFQTAATGPGNGQELVVLESRKEPAAPPDSEEQVDGRLPGKRTREFQIALQEYTKVVEAQRRAAEEERHAELNDKRVFANDVERLMGNCWQEVYLETGGSSEGELLGVWSFAHDRVANWHPDFKPFLPGDVDFPFIAGSFVVNEKSSPRHLDLVWRDKDQTITVLPGIYQWDGNRLKWCTATNQVDCDDEGKIDPAAVERARPTEFKTAANGSSKDNTLRILKRVWKPLAIPKP